MRVLFISFLLCSHLILLVGAAVPRVRRAGAARSAELSLSQLRERIFKTDERLVVTSSELFTQLPEELWTEIFRDAISSPQDLTVCLRICKSLNVVLRKDGTRILSRVVPDLASLESFLWDSELNLYDYMFPVILPRLKLHFRRHYGSASNRANLRLLRENIFARAADLDIIPKTFYFLPRTDNHLLALLRPFRSIFEHFFSIQTRRDQKFYYLPWTPGVRLLEVVDDQVLAAFGAKLRSSFFAHFFAPALLTDYIIPGFHDRSLITGHTKILLRLLLKHHSSFYYDYFKHLLWACYFQTGRTRKNERTLIRRISQYLEDDLGFNWRRLFSKFPKVRDQEKERLACDMLAVLIVARQWGLDLGLILERSADFSPLSVKILRGLRPEELFGDREIPAFAVLRVTSKHPIWLSQLVISPGESLMMHYPRMHPLHILSCKPEPLMSPASKRSPSSSDAELTETTPACSLGGAVSTIWMICFFYWFMLSEFFRYLYNRFTLQ